MVREVTESKRQNLSNIYLCGCWYLQNQIYGMFPMG